MDGNWSAGFTLDIPEDTFWRWADEDLVPSAQRREIALFGDLSPGLADQYLGPCDDASLWGIRTCELSPLKTKVVAWFDPHVTRLELSLWPCQMALDVIFSYYPEAPRNLDWQLDDPDSEAGALFVSAMRKLKRGEAGTFLLQAKAETAREDEPDPDNIPRWGTRRDLSTYEVKKIVKRCKSFQQLPGGSIAKFHEQESGKWAEEDSPTSYSLKTLQAWMKRFQ